MNGNLINLSGKQFGKWEVLRLDTAERKNRQTRWICRCECGRECSVVSQSLRTGTSTQCNHCQKKIGYVKDMIGERFGNLTVISRHNEDKKGAAEWLCLCDCGNTRVVTGSALRRPDKSKAVRKCVSCSEQGRERVYRVGMVIDGRKLVKKVPYRNNPKRFYFIAECITCGTQIQLKGLLNTTSECRTCKIRKNKLPLFMKRQKSQAKKRGLKWTLKQEEFNELISGDCFYCGEKPSQVVKRQGNLMYNGIDRVDNSKGYVSDNVVSCCGKCNYMKRHYSVDDFLEHCQKIVAHSRKGAFE